VLNISVELNSDNRKTMPDFGLELGFGKVFSDLMLLADFKNGMWANHRIVPFSKVSLHPASTILHYGAQIFEGLKAYRTAIGDIQLFRPIENLKRLNQSADRLCLPQIEEKDFLEMLTKFISLQKDFVPKTAGSSLYLRPVIFGNDETLGVYPPQSATFMLIASPVGSYYKGGLTPVKILVEQEDIRAAVGGTGAVKAGGNYAASLRATQKAINKSYNQVLWLDAKHKKYIEEVGAMNVFFVIDNTVVTPALTGSILPGITRASCIELLKYKGIKVEEKQISIKDIVSAIKNKTLTESFGTGTAAVVAPIGTIGYQGKDYIIGGNKIGCITQELYDTLTGIQFGNVVDTFGWSYKI